MPIHSTRVSSALAAFFAIFGLQAQAAETFQAVEQQARGETVYFNAWGGSRPINDYIAWAAKEIEARYGVHLVQVKLPDTATGVSTILSEKAAGKTAGGSVDLIWLNGENFAAMKTQGLLQADSWAKGLPNRRYLDAKAEESIARDFTVPTDGLESPWGTAKLVFFHDSARTSPESMPRSAAALLTWAEGHKGRFAYPLPPDFSGTAFLKQVLSEMAPDPARLLTAPDDAAFAQQTAPLWAYLDRLHPLLLHEGTDFPANYAEMEQKLADGEVDITFAFNPAEASAAIERGDLPESVRSFTFEKGTLGNTHYLAIPFNANAVAGAKVVANFLLSPEAQLRKQDPKIWGDPTVLSLETLDAEQRAGFAALDMGPATLKPDQLGPVLPEPHPGWVDRIEAEWKRRYGSAGTP